MIVIIMTIVAVTIVAVIRSINMHNIMHLMHIIRHTMMHITLICLLHDYAYYMIMPII